MPTVNPAASVVVIGGGQAGLSVSYYLKKLGLEPGNEFVVLDRGPGTGGAWQLRWEALRIGSAHKINDLPGMDELGLSFETADRTLPAKQVVAEYYAKYEEHYGLKIMRPASVTSVHNRGAALEVTFTMPDGVHTISTDILINATGTWGAPFIPSYPGIDTFKGRHVHTADYINAADFVGQHVVVVGGGTSAIGFLLELESLAEELTWVSRRPIDFLEEGELNLEAKSAAVAMQDEAARAGRALPSIVSGTGVPRTRRVQAGIDRGVLAARPMFSSIEPDGVRWVNSSFQKADAIIWSTGFRPELRHLSPLKLREKEGGIVVAQGASWKDPRIFFAGYGPQASTIGANRAGRFIARQAIATLTKIKREEREEQAQQASSSLLGSPQVIPDWQFAPPPFHPGAPDFPAAPVVPEDALATDTAVSEPTAAEQDAAEQTGAETAAEPAADEPAADEPAADEKSPEKTSMQEFLDSL